MMEALEITHVAGDSSTNPIEDKMKSCLGNFDMN